MFISYKKTLDLLLLNEQENIRNKHNFKISKLISSKEKKSIFTSSSIFKPDGIIISDTYNNPIFPIPEPKIDNSKFKLDKIYKQYWSFYATSNEKKTVFLPWHYLIHFIVDKYYVFNTRPINIKYPLTHNDIIISLNLIGTDNTNWNKETFNFFKSKKLKVENALHIGIVGDTYSDVYTKEFYRTISKFCIKPNKIYFKMKIPSSDMIFFLNIGDRFNRTYLLKELK
jgi:hypothetical protein